MSDIEYVRMVVETVLTRFGDRVPAWRILSVGPPDESMQPFVVPTAGLWGRPEPRQLVAVVGWRGTAYGPDSLGLFCFQLDFPVPEALATMVDHIQDNAIEESQGAPLPPCPGHQHPLAVGQVDDTVFWVCPKDPEHHREPVLPGT